MFQNILMGSLRDPNNGKHTHQDYSLMKLSTKFSHNFFFICPTYSLLQPLHDGAHATTSIGAGRFVLLHDLFVRGMLLVFLSPVRIRPSNPPVREKIEFILLFDLGKFQKPPVDMFLMSLDFIHILQPGFYIRSFDFFSVLASHTHMNPDKSIIFN